MPSCFRNGWTHVNPIDHLVTILFHLQQSTMSVLPWPTSCSSACLHLDSSARWLLVTSVILQLSFQDLRLPEPKEAPSLTYSIRECNRSTTISVLAHQRCAHHHHCANDNGEGQQLCCVEVGMQLRNAVQEEGK
jgi:hypothetical protein